MGSLSRQISTESKVTHLGCWLSSLGYAGQLDARPGCGGDNWALGDLWGLRGDIHRQLGRLGPHAGDVLPSRDLTLEVRVILQRDGADAKAEVP